jgi:sterol desaturase/sphingolipid hydroxylase (fatty acid hydroxylase superfamily)/creatinine amidohydrolase/Fe(II)-dependent formamide hydrolase-like protein
MDILNYITDYLSGHFTVTGYRTYWLYLVSAAVIGFAVYLKTVKRDWSLSGAVKFLFPKEVYLHRSSFVDYGFFAINAFLMLLLISPIVRQLGPGTTSFLAGILQDLDVPSMSGTPAWAPVVYFIAFVLVGDFMIFLSHWLQHRVPFLWQFHKVHHAAEVLNPLTVYRQHPMDLALSSGMFLTGTATVTVLFSHIFGEVFSVKLYGGLTAVTLLFYVFGYNLRHSHIRIGFGKTLDKWLVSPEQHQLHHSYVEAHWDKNMGLIFAVWDRLFRCHYLPAKDEEIKLGLPNDEHKEYSNPIACYIVPFKKAFRFNKGALAAWAVAMLGLSTASMAAGRFAPPTLHLEDLTWTEVDQALEEGYRAIIIPTGGTEQNGPHAILGKHNKIIRHTAEEVAKRHGKTLVAPVMAYVPEGSISPRRGHMRYAGTLSLREEVFEMVLEDTAKSLFAHGFRTVYILGDSGGSVAAQDRATEAVRADLKPGQRMIHLTDYYLENGQVEHLLDEGYSRDAIGYHAGIRDTSELVAVEPEAVRKTGLRSTRQDRGATGAYWTASPEIGETMLELKIDAALRQIEREEIAATRQAKRADD